MRIKPAFILPIIPALMLSCSRPSDTHFGNKARIDSLLALATRSDSLNDLENSIAWYSRVLEIDSLNITALTNRGRDLIALGHSATGLMDFDKAVRHSPSPDTYVKRGLACCMVDDYPRAFKDFTSAIHLDPGFGEAYYGYSLVKLHARQYRSALYWCMRADSVSYNEVLSGAIRSEIDKMKTDKK